METSGEKCLKNLLENFQPPHQYSAEMPADGSGVRVICCVVMKSVYPSAA